MLRSLVGSEMCIRDRDKKQQKVIIALIIAMSNSIQRKCECRYPSSDDYVHGEDLRDDVNKIRNDSIANDSGCIQHT